MAENPPRGAMIAPPNRRRGETHPLIGADVDAVHSALMQLFRGYPASAMDLLDDLRDRDPRVDSVCRTRSIAVQGRSWSVRPVGAFSNDRESLEIAAEVERIIRSIRSTEDGGWPTVIGDAMDGVLRGYSVFECEWDDSPNRRLNGPRRFHWRHPNRFIWDDEYKIRLWDSGFASRSAGQPLLEEHPDRFFVFSPRAGRASLPTRRGVMLGTIFPGLFKRNGWRWWVKAAERWGQPLPYIKLPTNDEEQADEALSTLNKMLADWAGVFYGDQEINIVPGSGNITPDVWSRMVDLANVEIAIQILGQNLTTEISGGSFAAAKTHQQVRGDLLIGDCTEIDAWITAQIIPAIVRYNWPDGGPDLAYQTDSGQHGTPSEIKEALDLARSKGFQPTDGAIKSLLARLGVELEPVPKTETAPRAIALAPTDIAKVVKVREARGSQGLEPFGDERDDMTITELDEANKAKAATAAAPPAEPSEDPAPAEE